MKETNYISKKQMMERLKFERDNGYPGFRKEIATVLHERYNFNLSNAQDIVWNNHLGNLLLEDMEWSQHMGPDYWAKFIKDNSKDESLKNNNFLMLNI